MITSPFPGMDPYLECHWGDVHNTLIVVAKRMLNDYLPRDLRARTQERIVVELPGDDDHNYFPDIRVVEEESRGGRATAVAGSAVATADPLVVHFDEPETQGFLEVIEAGPKGRVITVVEVVSPSNKYAGPGRDQYRQKQRDLYKGEVSLVEIDLLRAGPYVLQLPWEKYPVSHRTQYKACVHRGWQPTAEVYRVPLREPLPVIRVPLRESDADAPLDLQSLMAQVYHESRYDDIDYTVPPVPPLEAEDAIWADQLLRAAGKRPADAV